MRKKPKSLALHEPLRHPDHSRPRTRREFVAQGFMTGAATVLGPSLLGLLANPRSARAALAPDIATAVTGCGITTGAGKIPFICFDLAGGGNIAGSNVLVGGPKGQLDFLSVAGYSKLGLPGGMIPSPSASGNFIDSTYGLRFHSDSAHLRGIKARATSASAMANTTGTVIPALSQNDTNVNPHNPMYGVYSFGARGGLLDLIGSQSSLSGGNSMAPPNWIIPSAAPVKISSSNDSKGLVNTGQLGVLLPPADVTTVMESIKRLSDAKYAQVQAYTDATANAAALGPKGTQACGYTKAAYIVDKYNSPSAVNPDVDPNIVGSGGIFTTAEYQANSDYQKTAAVMKLVIDGNAAGRHHRNGRLRLSHRRSGDGRGARPQRRQLHRRLFGIRRACQKAGDDLCVQRRLACEQRHDRQFRRRPRQRACGPATIKTSPRPTFWSTTLPESRLRRKAVPSSACRSATSTRMGH